MALHFFQCMFLLKTSCLTNSQQAIPKYKWTAERKPNGPNQIQGYTH